jgi:hypothetical protein
MPPGTVSACVAMKKISATGLLPSPCIAGLQRRRYHSLCTHTVRTPTLALIDEPCYDVHYVTAVYEF